MLGKHGFETTRERSNLMGRIKSNNTKPELLLRKRLWKEGIRYKINNKQIIGNPDIVISRYKLIIFVDGEFWHGYNWKVKKQKIKSNRDYWIKKIERNIERDKQNNQLLKQESWTVLRFWEHQVKKDIDICIKLIKEKMLNH